MDNLILATDSYKLTHWKQYPEDTTTVYSYFESRKGAKWDETVFFGLQYLLQNYLEGSIVKQADVWAGEELAQAHFGDKSLFNTEGWTHIVQDHGGRLPLKIRALAEGTVAPVGSVLMTVENTCPKCFWLTNAVESLLTHVWYPSTVATLSREVKKSLKGMCMATSDDYSGLPFMLHDFGYRGASSHESAALGGAGHLVNFMGTDTLPAMMLAMEFYEAELGNLAFSVPATEHSVMTAEGEKGEMGVVNKLLEEYPSGILSVVADSYNIYQFVKEVCLKYRDRIMQRDGVFVVRPDSITSTHKTPEELTLNIIERLYVHFGGHVNKKGFKVLDPHIRVLWGDGIDPVGIRRIGKMLAMKGFSIDNMVFGMGGGLLQKVNRDTQRFAFKCSARQTTDGEWHDVFKKPIDASKASKAGRFNYAELVTVFEDGQIMKKYTFDEVRKNAEL